MSTRPGSFGGVAAPAARTLSAQWAIARLGAREARPDSMLGYGNGRSYGDTCLNPRGAIVEMRDLRRILDFDPEAGTIRVEAGVFLSEIIAHVAGHGYFLPVVPGTQFVTVGGAIANDVHGKNHHKRGTFGNHVLSFSLLRSDGVVRECTPVENDQLFSATIGGLGLTGLILSAELRLARVASLDIAERVTKFRNLREYLDLAEQADADNEYAVAWLDQLATGDKAGRGLLLAGNHADRPSGRRREPGARLGIPFTPPFTVLNQPFLRVFNTAYRLAKGRRAGTHVSDHQSYFFPLDGVRNWNRLYGPRGLHQHQSVIPFDAASEALPAMLAASHRAGQGSFLTVLKRFGSIASPGLLSFPRPGYTLTLDFPNRGEATLALLAELDRIAIDAGGAVNPYKDSRMSDRVFAASFPNWRGLAAMRDPAFSSGFWQRTGGRLRPSERHLPQAAE